MRRSVSPPTRSRAPPARKSCTTCRSSRIVSTNRLRWWIRSSRKDRMPSSLSRSMTSRWVGSVKRLNDAKIPVILVSNPLPGSFVTYVGADDFEIGYREARYLFENLGAKGKIVVIEGTPAAPTNRERLRGYQRAFAEFPGIEVLGSGVGTYQQTDARG